MNKSLARKRLDTFIEQAAKEAHERFQSPDRSYLDLGCGGSPYSHLFKGWGRIGMDFEERQGVDVVGDVHTLPFEDARFDLILCTEVLEHVVRPQSMLKEAHRTLKNGGMLVITTRFVYPIHQAPYDHFRYTVYGLEYLLKESGFTIQSIKPDTSSLEAVGVLLDTLAKNAIAAKPAKAILYGFGWILKRLPKLTKKEYGDMRAKNMVELPSIITNGYHIVAIKQT